MVSTVIDRLDAYIKNGDGKYNVDLTVFNEQMKQLSTQYGRPISESTPTPGLWKKFNRHAAVIEARWSAGGRTVLCEIEKRKEVLVRTTIEDSDFAPPASAPSE